MIKKYRAFLEQGGCFYFALKMACNRAVIDWLVQYRVRSVGVYCPASTTDCPPGYRIVFSPLDCHFRWTLLDGYNFSFTRQKKHFAKAKRTYALAVAEAWEHYHAQLTES